jgi:hypothetical protein
MAADQKYCLDCGRRKGDPRVDFNEYMDDGRPAGVTGTPGPPVPPLPPQPPAEPVSAAPDDRPEREVTPLMAAAGLAAFAIILLLGVTIGRLGGDSDTPQVVAATGTPTTAVAPPTTTAPGTDTTVSLTIDWPEGKEGWTVEIATLPKDSADPAAVEATQADLVSRGAAEAGVLDSDQFASLPPGNYVFYSGVFDSKADAEAELETLSSSFPDAQVVEVTTQAVTTSGGGGGGGGGGDPGALIQEPGSETTSPVEATKEDLEALNNDTSAEEFQELQQKLPPTIETPGAPPPTDDKAPGAGSDAVEIG